MSENRLIFQDAVRARNAIALEQRRKIHDLYSDWAEEIDEFARHYPETKTTTNPALTALYCAGLLKMLTKSNDRISGEVEKIATSSIRKMSEAVVSSNTKWLTSLGFSAEYAASKSAVPDAIVQRISSGKAYGGKPWNLSSAIWGDNKETHRQIREIIEGGIKEGKPVHQISKDIERFVNPDKRKPWNLRNAKGRKIYPRDVDYNAQRLVRTTIQESYQESLYESTKDNDLIIGWTWVANGSRVCKMCEAKNGTFLPKEDGAPQDHPQGMCVFPPVLATDWLQQLRDKRYS